MRIAAVVALVAVLAAIVLRPRSARPADGAQGDAAATAPGSPAQADVDPAAGSRAALGPDAGAAGVLEAEGELWVRTVDAAGTAVPGAEVWRSNGDGSQGRAGRTDADGRLRLEPPRDLTELRARTPDAFARRTFGPDAAAPASGELELRLEFGGRLDGRLVDHRGRALGAGIEVLAFPETVAQSGPRALDALLSERGELWRTLSDDEGRFAFAGLPLDPLLVLRAAGAGHALQRPLPAGRARLPESSPDPLELRLLPVFAAAIDLLTPGGQPATISPALTTLEAESAELSAPELRLHPQVSQAARANGLDLFERDALPVHRRLFLMSAAVDVEQGIEIVYRADFPGYRPAEVRARALSAGAIRTLGELPATPLELQSDGEGFGSVVLVADGPRPGSLDRLPAGELRLSGVGRAETFRVDADASGLTRLDGLPQGTYTVGFRSSNGLLAWPPPGQLPPRVTVGPEPADLHLSHRPAGRIAIAPRTSLGQPFGGTLTVGLVAQENVRPDSAGGVELSQVAVLTLAQPPYVLEPVPAGDWFLDLMAPDSALSGQLVPVRVEAQLTTPVPVEGLLP